MLANVYLHRIDRVWDVREHGVLVRYADDVVIMCRSRRQAEDALAHLVGLLSDLGLTPKVGKTRIVHLAEDAEGLDFLGFHHRWVRSQGRSGVKGIGFLARWPSDKAMAHARDVIRELTVRSRLLLSVGTIVERVNRFLRGWTGYFCYGNSSVRFAKIREYALMRLAGFLAKRHKRSRAFGRSVVFHSSNDQLGLISLEGTVYAPRPFRAWRRTSRAVNDLGEPCAGEPHARFDGRGLETEHPGQGSEEEQPSGKLFGSHGFAAYRQDLPPRQPPTLRG